MFHAYGFLVGVALVTGITLIERKYLQLKYSESSLWKFVVSALIFGIFFARLWHVVSDFHLYSDNLVHAFYIWEGGLGIIGGIIGGVIGIACAGFLFAECRKVSIPTVLDVAVFGIPFAQAIGRLGNYVNQELYGLPTDTFLGIYIDSEHRLFGYADVEYYHPLFFYELVLMLSFGSLLHFFDKKGKLPKIGRGKIFLMYVLYYSVVRFLLDFVRLDKNLLFGSSFSDNQMFLLVVVVLIYTVWSKGMAHGKKK